MLISNCFSYRFFDLISRDASTINFDVSLEIAFVLVLLCLRRQTLPRGQIVTDIFVIPKNCFSDTLIIYRTRGSLSAFLLIILISALLT